MHHCQVNLWGAATHSCGCVPPWAFVHVQRTLETCWGFSFDKASE